MRVVVDDLDVGLLTPVETVAALPGMGPRERLVVARLARKHGVPEWWALGFVQQREAALAPRRRQAGEAERQDRWDRWFEREL